MWSDAQADPPRCPGSGTSAEPAPRLADGFPDGCALCPECTGFVRVERGVLVNHDAFRDPDDAADAAHRAAWFNSIGWN
ncbi:hypothetical protein HW566_01695 [Microbacterium oleivorans]|uniref:Uncharacterized protein n=1 Tax=Microbacterium oleivorans TaxID=273677 RepID=A0A7D5JEV0_9MICO|nr:hypothetical protein HW566_01695 [Microbacterium oleivorans]